MPTARLCPLADVAARLPADSWIAQRQAEATDALATDTVLCITGDVQVPELHLDAPLASGGPLRALLQGGIDAPAPTGPPFLVLIEGQKHLQIPKIEVWRPALGRTPRYGEDPCVIAVATDAVEDLAGACSLPVLNLDAVESVADFVLAQWRQGCLYPLLSSSQSSSQR